MKDIHTHIIPCVDDGSPNLETSIDMIKHEISIGVDTIYCTPHHILSRYEKSVEEIKKFANDIRTYLINPQNIDKAYSEYESLVGVAFSINFNASAKFANFYDYITSIKKEHLSHKT